MSIAGRMKREENEVRDREGQADGMWYGKEGGTVDEWRVVVWSQWLS